MSVTLNVDAREAEARLKTLAPKVRARVGSVVAVNAAKLEDVVRRNLSGGVLQARTGRLRDSIQVESDGAGFRVFSDAPYARVQEYGGKIDIPETVPVNAKALAFEYAGKLVFATHARAHEVVIPERSFMRSALAEIAPLFLEDLRDALGAP